MQGIQSIITNSNAMIPTIRLQNALLLTYATLMGLTTITLALWAIKMMNEGRVSSSAITGMMIVCFLGAIATIIVIRGYLNNKVTERDINRMTRNN